MEHVPEFFSQVIINALQVFLFCMDLAVHWYVQIQDMFADLALHDCDRVRTPVHTWHCRVIRDSGHLC
jgi:hypothetical protein